MDRDTLSHYGWIVVMLLCLSVLLAFATPLGKFMRTAAWNYIVAIGEAIIGVDERIDDDKEKNDIELNGSFIITDKDGNERCYVFNVNDDYDAYSLVSDGKVPKVNDRYFRCVNYVNIEERRTVKEMFHLSSALGYDDTVEERQGIQCALLHFVNGNDYSEYASTISSTARSVYDDLLAKSGSLDHSEYDYVELIAIEKEDYIDMIIVSYTGEIQDAPTDETGLRITLSDRDKMHLELENQIIYCNDRSKVMPYVNDLYKIKQFTPNNQLKQVAMAIDMVNDGTDEFRTASQWAVWQCYESTDMVLYSKMVDGEVISNYVKQILDTAETVNPDDVDLIFKLYEALDTSKDYQDVVCFTKPDFKGWQVPKNGQYTMISDNGGYGKTVYNEFEYLPYGYECQVGDIYTDLEYEYRYGQDVNVYVPGNYADRTTETIELAGSNITVYKNNNVAWNVNSLNGWGVYTVDKTKTSYSNFIEPNYAPVVSCDYTFNMCMNMTTSPIIPNTVIRINGIYYNCQSLEIAPDFSNYENITSLSDVFYDCQSLRTYEGSTESDGGFNNYPISNKITSLYSTFKNCDKITNVSTFVVPDNVTEIDQIFAFCDGITVALIIPNHITDMSGVFAGCKNMKTYYGSTEGVGTFTNYPLPSGLENLSNTFAECEVMVLAPKNIPNSVTNMGNTFDDCISLTTAPILHNGITDLDNTFSGCTSLCTYYGSADANGDFRDYILPNTLYDSYSGGGTLVGTFSGCRSMIYAPAIPNNVVNMNGTFQSSGLIDEGMPIIPNGVTTMSSTFSVCSSIVDLGDYVIPNSVTNMMTMFYGCSNLKVAPTISANATNLVGTFQQCGSLNDISNIVIPDTNPVLSQMFISCYSLSGSVKMECQTIDTSSFGYGGFIAFTNITSIEGSCSDSIKELLLQNKIDYENAHS